MNAKFAPVILFLAAHVAFAADPSAFEIHAVGNTPGASAKEYSFTECGGEKQTLLVDQKVLLDGSGVKAAKLEHDQDGHPEVAITLTETGAKRFEEITTEFTGQRLAILLAGELQVAPKVNQPILGASITISGAWSEKEAAGFVSLLNKAVQQ
jgi:preprotein translocase subunit SecD